jgi:hypothetical protein
MATRSDIQNDLGKALFAMPEDVRAGMLGLMASGTGLQPMTHVPEAEAGVIGFISSMQSALVQAVGLGEDADDVVVSRDHDMHASLHGLFLFQAVSGTGSWLWQLTPYLTLNHATHQTGGFHVGLGRYLSCDRADCGSTGLWRHRRNLCRHSADPVLHLHRSVCCGDDCACVAGASARLTVDHPGPAS